MRRVSLCPIEFRSGDARDAGDVTHPDSPCAIGEDPEHAVLWKAVCIVPGGKFLAFEAAQSSFRSNPHSTLVIDIYSVYEPARQAIAFRITVKVACVENHHASAGKAKPHSSFIVSPRCENELSFQQMLVGEIRDVAVYPAEEPFVTLQYPDARFIVVRDGDH